MQKIYTDQTLFAVTNVQNLLAASHVQGFIRNEFAAGGIGEIASVDAWPELWVAYPDVALAKEIINAYQSDSNEKDWTCSCGEINGSVFGSCWACQRDKPKHPQKSSSF
jgi:hypothetical protein